MSTFHFAIAVLLILASSTSARDSVGLPPDVCQNARTTIDASISVDVESLLIIDNFACSKCVQEILKSSVLKKAGKRFGVVISSVAYSHYAPTLRKLDCPIAKLSSEEVQKCLYAEYSLAIYKRSSRGFSLVMDVPVDGVPDALEYIKKISINK